MCKSLQFCLSLKLKGMASIIPLSQPLVTLRFISHCLNTITNVCIYLKGHFLCVCLFVSESPSLLHQECHVLLTSLFLIHIFKWKISTYLSKLCSHITSYKTFYNLLAGSGLYEGTLFGSDLRFPLLQHIQ